MRYVSEHTMHVHNILAKQSVHGRPEMSAGLPPPPSPTAPLRSPSAHVLSKPPSVGVKVIQKRPEFKMNQGPAAATRARIALSDISNKGAKGALAVGKVRLPFRLNTRAPHGYLPNNNLQSVCVSCHLRLAPRLVI